MSGHLDMYDLLGRLESSDGSKKKEARAEIERRFAELVAEIAASVPREVALQGCVNSAMEALASLQQIRTAGGAPAFTEEVEAKLQAIAAGMIAPDALSRAEREHKEKNP